jgi:2-oxoglutarate ferredoxin oxidoreductase subunit gamma
MAKRVEVLVSGFGGQGVVRIGQAVSKASVSQGYFTTMLVSHGTETRGGYVRTQTVMSEDEIDSPVVENPDFFIALSKAAYNRFKHLVKKGVVIYDPSYVDALDEELAAKVKHVPLNARDLAVQKFGKELFSNSVIMGYLAKNMEGIIDKEILVQSMLESVPKFHAENKAAFDFGYSLEI